MTEADVINKKSGESTNLSLLAKVQSNDGHAWAMLVDLYAPMIYSRCRYVHGLKPGDAENVGQEVFKSVAKSISNFERKREGSFRTWLRIIINNKCKDLFRKKTVADAQGGSVALDLIAAVPDSIAEEDAATSELSDRAILMRQAMKEVRNEFSERDWQIFWDIVVEDKDRKDTALKYETSVNAVYLAISRIRKRLKAIFEDLIDDDLFPEESFD